MMLNETTSVRIVRNNDVWAALTVLQEEGKCIQGQLDDPTCSPPLSLDDVHLHYFTPWLQAGHMPNKLSAPHPPFFFRTPTE